MRGTTVRISYTGQMALNWGKMTNFRKIICENPIQKNDNVSGHFQSDLKTDNRPVVKKTHRNVHRKVSHSYQSGKHPRIHSTNYRTTIQRHFIKQQKWTIRLHPGVDNGLWLVIVRCYGIVNDNEGTRMPDANEGRGGWKGIQKFSTFPHFSATLQLLFKK